MFRRDVLLPEVMGHSLVVSAVLVWTRIDVDHGRAQPGDLVEKLVVRLLGDAVGQLQGDFAGHAFVQNVRRGSTTSGPTFCQTPASLPRSPSWLS